MVRRIGKPVPLDGSQQSDQLNTLGGISASFWACYSNKQDNGRGKQSVMMWQGVLSGTEVPVQWPL